MKKLIKRIAESFPDHPEQVEVTKVHGSTVTVIELKVTKEDMGQVIGKKGLNAAAIRTALEAAGKKLKRRVVLEIIE